MSRELLPVNSTAVNVNYLPLLSAMVSTRVHKSARAIESLQPAEEYDLGFFGYVSMGFTETKYTAWTRGQSDLAANEGQKAVAEFQKVVDPPGLIGEDLIGALATGRGQMPETKFKPKPNTKSSWLSGRMPTRIFPFFCRRKRNIPVCSIRLLTYWRICHLPLL
jgi:hypothetical protein